MTSNIQISKGSYTVVLHTTEVDDGFSNSLRAFTPAQTSQKQDSGQKDTMVTDLLKITRDLKIRGFIIHHGDTGGTKTIKQQKDDLINILRGAGGKGGTATLSYDGDSIGCFIKELQFHHASKDNKTDEKYEVQITVTEGVKIG